MMLRPLIASLTLTALCTAQVVSITKKFDTGVHDCIWHCLEWNDANPDVGDALSCDSPVDNACFCPTETQSVSKATSFLASCAKARCGAGDLKKDAPLMVGLYATYCHEAGFTQPGLEPTESPPPETSDTPTGAQATSDPSSAPKGGDSQPSKTADDEDVPGTSTQRTIVTQTKDSGATKSQVVVQVTSTVFVGGSGGGGGLSTGGKIGIGVAVPVAALAVAGIALCFWVRRRRSRKGAAVDAAALASRRRAEQEEEDERRRDAEKTANANISRKPVADPYSVSATSTSPISHELRGNEGGRFTELSDGNTQLRHHEADGQVFEGGNMHEMQGSAPYSYQQRMNSPSELPAAGNR